VDVYFPPGTSTAAIFRRLMAEGVVPSARLAGSTTHPRERDAAAGGQYQFDRPMPIDEIIRRMGRGDVVQHSVVVPEGLTGERPSSSSWTPASAPRARTAFSNTGLLPGLAAARRTGKVFSFPKRTA
jgi:cell division protein YceG involved in septum cleavage